MSMTAGSVTVANDETATGSGLAKARYDADFATLSLPTVPVLGATAAPYSAARPVTSADIDAVRATRLAALREVARRVTAYATADVAYFQANMVARVFPAGSGPSPGTGTAALQQAGGIDTTAPTTIKDLPIF